MKFGIAAKLALLLALVGITAAVATGYLAYQHSRAQMVKAAQKELITSTQVLGRRIATEREAIGRDLRLLVHHPAASAMLLAPNATHEEQLGTLFRLFMQSNPGYFQIRLISASDHGLEIVRMDRNADRIIPVTGDDLQEKGHFAYVSDTLKLPPDEVYLSRFTINHERGSNAAQDQPSAQLSMPVYEGKQLLGLVVINIDITRFFHQLMLDLPPDFHVYLANQSGDVLIHPDESKTFGFDKGRRVLIQDEFPATRALLERRTSQAVQIVSASERDHPRAAAFSSFSVVVSSAEPLLLLGLSQPLDGLEDAIVGMRNDMLPLLAGISAISLVLAVALARLVTHPLKQLTTAARNLASTHSTGALPIRRRDEIGELARTFEQMAVRMQSQMQNLQDNQDEFEFLAHHDTLTNLPNRRMLLDRLQQAIAHARRENETVTLLFIDIDNFKQINDSLGHNAGDLVLIAVADRLRGLVRTNDTVARLGGDEFVVLLDGHLERENIEHLVAMLTQAIKAAIPTQDKDVNISVSIGISQFPQDGTSADALLSSADNAMYRVKAAGRNGFGFATPD